MFDDHDSLVFLSDSYEIFDEVDLLEDGVLLSLERQIDKLIFGLQFFIPVNICDDDRIFSLRKCFLLAKLRQLPRYLPSHDSTHLLPVLSPLFIKDLLYLRIG